jgi:hypothetical protein
MTLLDKIKARIDEAEAEYSTTRKGSQERLQAGMKLEAALKDAIGNTDLILNWPGTVKDPEAAHAAAETRRSAEEYGKTATQRMEHVLAERQIEETK